MPQRRCCYCNCTHAGANAMPYYVMPAHSGTYNMAWLPSWVAVRTLYVRLPLRAYKMAMYMYYYGVLGIACVCVFFFFSDLSVASAGICCRVPQDLSLTCGLLREAPVSTLPPPPKHHYDTPHIIAPSPMRISLINDLHANTEYTYRRCPLFGLVLCMEYKYTLVQLVARWLCGAPEVAMVARSTTS